MKLIARTAAFALAIAPAFAHAEDKGTTKTTSQKGSSSADAEKMTDARAVALLHHVNQEEIKAGKLAQEKGQSADIKSYGQQLVTDHTQADQQLMTVAKQAGVSATSSALTTHDQEMMRIEKNKMDQLKQMSGAEFDRTFAQVMSRDHDHMVSMLKQHRGDIQSADLKKLVDDTIPTLQQHKDLADKAMKNAGRSGTNQGRTPDSDRRAMDTSQANQRGTTKADDRGDSSAKSGAPEPEKR